MTIVDAHIHLWDLSRFSLSWFRDDMGLPREASPEAFHSSTASPVERAGTLRLAGARSATDSRDETPQADLDTPPVAFPLVERARNERDETPQADLETHHATTAIAVQAGDTLPEMQWLLKVAATDPRVRAVVLQYVPGPEGWAGLATSVLNDRVHGIRVATPGGAADLSDVPGLDALCSGAGESGRVVEFLVRPAQLDAVARVAARHPHTRFVLCHLGLGAGVPTPEWEGSLRRVAAQPHTAAKFSGLVTGVEDHARLAALAATASTLLGADRLMFGSDWPMSSRVTSYARLVDDVAIAWGDRPDAFWGATAAETYGL
ncbi:amidohydrolase family protein [Microbacterium jejuense]|uniref:Amidohydrolase family protein n=1 Tax=Microbacterium jejuense TaxID=1263637 RepID=A0ABS7HIB3_9MICO|nr:amidohydrolase family protein [Microbacterium jejuense]MBW9092677.1 amidohydrolase family protein [Microbacterium jejuense]